MMSFNIYQYSGSSRLAYAWRLIVSGGFLNFLWRVGEALRLRLEKLIINLFWKYRQSGFTYEGNALAYLVHDHNGATYNERAIEVPIGLKTIEDFEGKRIMEVGAVLGHYSQVSWDVLDKFEQGEGIINQDIVSYRPKKKYDLVISVSTFEHIGFDDDIVDDKAVSRSVANIRSHCLNKGGMFLITVPVGYNPNIDRLLENNSLEFDSIDYYLRHNVLNQWEEVSLETISRARYSFPFVNANVIAVCKFLND